MSQWLHQSHTITLSGGKLPEITGEHYGKPFAEPLLHVRRIRGHEAIGKLHQAVQIHG